MNNPLTWKIVELSNSRGAQKWAIRRWRGFYQYMDLCPPPMIWKRRDAMFDDCISDDPQEVLKVYNNHILTRSRVVSLESLKKLIFHRRLQGE